MLRLLSLTAVVVVAVSTPSTLSAQVEWMTWDEAIAANAKAPRKIFVDVYTDWCGWCHRMDKTTFRDPEVAALLNRDFYPVKLNAEQREAITFRGETYEFEATGRRGAHQLARKLLRGRMGYPTVVFLDEEAEVIQPIPGYQDGDAMEKIVRYFGSDTYRTTPWAEYSGE